MPNPPTPHALNVARDYYGCPVADARVRSLATLLDRERAAARREAVEECAKIARAAREDERRGLAAGGYIEACMEIEGSIRFLLPPAATAKPPGERETALRSEYLDASVALAEALDREAAAVEASNEAWRAADERVWRMDEPERYDDPATCGESRYSHDVKKRRAAALREFRRAKSALGGEAPKKIAQDIADDEEREANHE